MFDFMLVVVSKVIETQAIFFGIYDFTQLSLKAAALCCVQQALKDGTLYPLSIIDTLFGDLPQSLTARSTLYRSIASSTRAFFRIPAVSIKTYFPVSFSK